MAAMGEWKDRLCCSKCTCASLVSCLVLISPLIPRLHTPGSCIKPYLEKLCSKHVQISDSLCATSWSIYFQIGLPVPFIGRRDHCLGTYRAKKQNNISASSNLTVFILHFSDMDALMDTQPNKKKHQYPYIVQYPVISWGIWRMRKQWIPGHSLGWSGQGTRLGGYIILVVVVNDHIISVVVCRWVHALLSYSSAPITPSLPSLLATGPAVLLHGHPPPPPGTQLPFDPNQLPLPDPCQELHVPV